MERDMLKSRAILIGPLVHMGPMTLLDEPDGYRCVVLMDHGDHPDGIVKLFNLGSNDKDKAIEQAWQLANELSETTKVYVAKSAMHFGKTALKYWPTLKDKKIRVKDIHDEVLRYALYRTITERPKNATLQ